jgi:hypothetical protein
MKLQQGQIITTHNGTGAIHLTELSNDSAKQKLPRLVLMRPSWYDETTGHTQPAASFQVIDPRELYEFLRSYYEEAP